VLADFAHPAPQRLLDAWVGFGDYVVSGTLRRFFKAFWRFGLFFLTPFVEVVLFAILAALAGWGIATALASGGIAFVLLWLTVGAALFSLLMRWPGRRWRVSQALALFVFARRYARGQSDIDQRVGRFAQRLQACARAGTVDEILLVGHSIGAAIAIDALAQALACDPDLGRHGPSVRLLTVGSTIPQVALHPSAGRLRACTQRVADEATIAWAEFQARDDAINFYRFDPVTLTCRLDDDGRKPQIRRVHLHEMLTPATFQRYRWHFMRLHYQFVMANERRTMYDYFMLVCGPMPFSTMLGAARGPAELFSDDGSAVATSGDASQAAVSP